MHIPSSLASQTLMWGEHGPQAYIPRVFLSFCYIQYGMNLGTTG